MECVWWLQMSLSRLGELTALPKSLSWIWEATLWREKGKAAKVKKRDRSDGRKPPPPANKCPVKALLDVCDICSRSSDLLTAVKAAAETAIVSRAVSRAWNKWTIHRSMISAAVLTTTYWWPLDRYLLQVIISRLSWFSAFYELSKFNWGL